jgi:hypothetical protein
MEVSVEARAKIEALRLEFAARSGIEHDALVVTETIKFLWLMSCEHSCASRLIAEIIDEIWHEFILDTRFYERLCLSLPGKFFIHHEPGLVSSLPSDEEAVRCVLALSDYVRLFGSFTAESVEYWPAVKQLADTFGLSVDEFNARLASLPHPRKTASEPFDSQPVKEHRFAGVQA